LADGRVVISTELDNEQLEKDVRNTPKAFSVLKSALKDVAAASDTAFGSKQERQIDTITQRLARQNEAIQRAARDVENLRRQYEAVAGMETTPASLRRMETELSRVQREIQKTEREYERLEESLRRVQDAAEFERMATGVISPENAVEIERLTGELETAGQRLQDMDTRAEDLQASIDRIRLSPEGSREAQILADRLQNAEDRAARLANEAAATSARLEELRTGPEQGTSAMEAFSQSVNRVNSGILSFAKKSIAAFGKLIGHIKRINIGLKGTSKQTHGATGMIEKFRKRIISLAIAAFIFNRIRRALRELSTYLGSALKTNEQYVASLASIKGNLLTAFQPIYEIIMPALNTFMAGLARVTGYLAAFISFITGKSLKASQDAAESLYDQVDAMDALGNSAKKAAGRLASFDTINQLASATAEDSKIVPDFEYDLSAMEDFFSQFDKIADAFYAVGERIANAVNNFLGDIDWNSIQNKARTAAESIASFLNGIVDNVDWVLIGYSLGQGANTALTFLETFIDTFHWHTLGLGLAAGLNSMVSTIDWLMLGRVVYKGINSVFDTIYTFMTTTDWDKIGRSITSSLNTAIAGINWDLLGRTFASKWRALVDVLYAFVTTFDWPAFGRAISTSVNAWFDEIDWAKAGLTISTGILGLLDTLLSFIETVDWYKIGKSIGDFFANIDWKTILSRVGQVIGSVLSGIFASIWAMLGAEAKDVEKAFRSLMEWFQKNAGVIGEVIAIVLQLIAAFTITTSVAKIVAAAIAALSSPVGLAAAAIAALIAVITLLIKNWETLKEVGAKVWSALKNTIIGDAVEIGKGVITAFQGIITFISGAFTGNWKKAWDGIGKIVTGVFNTIASTFRAFCNIFIDLYNGLGTALAAGINAITSSLNKIQITVPEWVPGFGGKKFGFNIPKITYTNIPRLATGAVIPPNQEFAAILGDQKHGRNLELPESLLETMLDERFGRLEELLERFVDGAGGGLSITADPSMAALIRILFPYLEEEIGRRGGRMSGRGAFANG